MVGNPLMVEDHIRDLAAIQKRDEWIVDEMQEYDVGLRVHHQGVAYYSFHTKHLVPWTEEVGVVIDRCLYEQQVGNSFGEHVLLESESMGSRPEGSYSSID